MIDDVADKITNLQNQLDKLVYEEETNFEVLSELFTQLEPLLDKVIANSNEPDCSHLLLEYQKWLASMTEIMTGQKKKILSDLETLNKGRKASDNYNKNI